VAHLKKKKLASNDRILFPATTKHREPYGRMTSAQAPNRSGVGSARQTMASTDPSTPPGGSLCVISSCRIDSLAPRLRHQSRCSVVDAVAVISREGCHARAREIVQLPPPPRSSDDEEGFLPGGGGASDDVVIRGQADLAKGFESRQSCHWNGCRVAKGDPGRRRQQRDASTIDQYVSGVRSPTRRIGEEARPPSLPFAGGTSSSEEIIGSSRQLENSNDSLYPPCFVAPRTSIVIGGFRIRRCCVERCGVR